MSVMINTIHSHLSVTAFALHKGKLLTSSTEKDFEKTIDAIDNVILNVVGNGIRNRDTIVQEDKFINVYITIGDEYGKFDIRRSTGHVSKWQFINNKN